MAAFYVAGACRLGSRQRSRIAATATVAKRKLRQWVAWNTILIKKTENKMLANLSECLFFCLKRVCALNG